MRIKFLLWLMRKLFVSTVDSYTTTRREHEFKTKRYKLRLRIQLIGCPIRYTREELVVMLGEIREHEKRMGWKVPDETA